MADTLQKRFNEERDEIRKRLIDKYKVPVDIAWRKTCGRVPPIDPAAKLVNAQLVVTTVWLDATPLGYVDDTKDAKCAHWDRLFMDIQAQVETYCQENGPIESFAGSLFVMDDLTAHSKFHEVVFVLLNIPLNEQCDSLKLVATTFTQSITDKLNIPSTVGNDAQYVFPFYGLVDDAPTDFPCRPYTVIFPVNTSDTDAFMEKISAESMEVVKQRDLWKMGGILEGETGNDGPGVTRHHTISDAMNNLLARIHGGSAIMDAYLCDSTTDVHYWCPLYVTWIDTIPASTVKLCMVSAGLVFLCVDKVAPPSSAMQKLSLHA